MSAGGPASRGPTRRSTCSPCRVTVEGDRATCAVHAQVVARLANAGGGTQYLTGSCYEFGLLRQTDGWAICSVTLTVLWNDGNPHPGGHSAPISQYRLNDIVGINSRSHGGLR